MTLRQFAALSTELTAEDPTRHVVQVELLNTAADRPEFDVTLTVAYDVYLPASTDRPAG